MNGQYFITVFVRQCASACAWFVGLACIVERLAPGTILANLDLNYFWLVIGAVGLTVLAPESPRPVSRLATFLFALPVGVLLIGFVFLITSSLGNSGLIISGAVAVLTLTALLAGSFRDPSSGRRLFGMVF
jgi:hypothetical protein